MSFKSGCVQCLQVPYYLDEDHNWAINVENLRKSIAEGRKHCDPSMMICINPGNPTGECYGSSYRGRGGRKNFNPSLSHLGQLLNEDNIRQIIQFCHEEQVVLLADEVRAQAFTC